MVSAYSERKPLAGRFPEQIIEGPPGAAHLKNSKVNRYPALRGLRASSFFHSVRHPVRMMNKGGTAELLSVLWGWMGFFIWVT